MKNNNFASKKLRILIVVLTLTTMLTTLTGCFGIPGINSEDNYGGFNLSSDDYNPNSSDEESYQPTAPTKTYKLDETATISDLDITATSVKESEGDEYNAPANGNVLLGIELLIENNSQNDVEISMYSNFEAYVDDMTTPYSFEAGSFFNDYSNDGKIAAGKKLTCYYPLEVPEDWKKTELYFYEKLYYTDKKESAIFLITNPKN